MGEELDSSYYNDAVDRYNKLKKSPELTPFYPLWRLMLGRIDKSKRIGDFGCGTGQFALLAMREGFTYERGIDFSPRSIEVAKKINPGNEYKFLVGDLRDGSIYNFEYDIAVFSAVLEHITDDISVLKMIEIGKDVLALLPSRDSKGHVRYFSSSDEIRNRYSSYISINNIFVIHHGKNKNITYIMEGKRYDG